MKTEIDTEPKDEPTLWVLMTKGDPQAMEVIYQRYYTLLLDYGLKCTADRELVKDCIHDLFVNLYRNRHIGMEGITVRAYLLKALRHNIIHKLTEVEKGHSSLDEYTFEIPADENLFEQMFPKNDHDLVLARSLLKAIAQLPPQQQTALYLRYVKNLSHKEVAHVMNIKVQSSMNLLNRSLQKLRSLLEQTYVMYLILILGIRY